MTNSRRRGGVLLLLPLLSGCWLRTSPSGVEAPADWAYYGGDAGGSRYSPLTQINRTNVAQLRVAWIHHTGDMSDGSDGRPKSEFEATPIVVDGVMYLSTPFNRVLALHPETGHQKWSFDPHIDLHRAYSEGLMNRGVSLWIDSSRTAGTVCRTRIFLATIDARLFSLDAASGTPCADFGSGGEIDLTRGIPNVIRRGEYEETSAPALADRLVIVGSAIADNDRVASPSGVVRAFGARTGALRWSWDPLPATQPFPVAPPPLAPQRLTADDAWRLTSDERMACRARMQALRSDGVFTPPSVRGTIAYPGNIGGMNWSSGAFEPSSQLFVTNVNNVPMEVHLIPRSEYERVAPTSGEGRFRAEVSSAPSFPSASRCCSSACRS